MIPRIDVRMDPEAEAAGFDKMTTIVTITLNDGRVIKGRADFGKGSPSNPMSDAELAEKFHGCAAWGGLDRAKAAQVLDMLWDIEKMADVGQLTKLLRKESKE
jgi:2-methylcitrate dehydratase PrpD